MWNEVILAGLVSMFGPRMNSGSVLPVENCSVGGGVDIYGAYVVCERLDSSRYVKSIESYRGCLDSGVFDEGFCRELFPKR